MCSYRPLHDGWTVAPAFGTDPADLVPAEVARAGQLPATVPGCVHTDLLDAGLIPDPYRDDNEHRVAWVGRTDWAYQSTFHWDPDSPGDRVDLVCDGLDTVATVRVNGTELGRTANMHRGYRFPVRELLRPGDNQLEVRFDSAYRYAEELRDRLGDLPSAYPDQPYQFIRKNACNFGWDWGPTLVTAGIWRSIGLHSWRTARLAQVRPQVTVAGGEGRVALSVEVEWDGDAGSTPVTVTATVANVRGHVTLAPGERHATITLAVADPDLWWPRGYGAQPRYDLALVLASADGSELDTWSRRIGFRSVTLNTTPDASGTPFTFVVNGVPVFARGFNWIPDDVFLNRVDRQRYAARLDQACAANVNLIRVWGGGIYETDDFYDLCDERGLLVTQDFLFACAAYPEEQPIYDEVAAEAQDNVVRLAHHPSLVAWFGNNENIWGWHDWNWQPALKGRRWGAGYYFDLLPKLVGQWDPSRPYWPGSPYSGSPHQHPNEPTHGSMHIWDVWNAEDETQDYTHYRSYTPRFVAEFGWQAPPAYATLRRSVSDKPLAADSPGVLHHQKAKDGNNKLHRGLTWTFELPSDFDNWHWLMQLNQARAMTVGVEHLRSLYPLCMGSVVWQLNDCWPVTSWAAVDGDGRRKPVWYALRRSYADRLLTIQPRKDGLSLIAVNDSPEPWSAPVAVSRRGMDGLPHSEVELEIAVGPRSAVTLPLPVAVTVPEDPRSELLLAEAGGLRGWWFFARDRHLAYPRAEFDAVVEPVAGAPGATAGGGAGAPDATAGGGAGAPDATAGGGAGAPDATAGGGAGAPDATAGGGAGQVSRAEVQVTVTAASLLRDLTLLPDRLDPSAEVDEALVTLLPGEKATFTVTSGVTLDPAALTAPPVLRCANDLA